VAYVIHSMYLKTNSFIDSVVIFDLYNTFLLPYQKSMVPNWRNQGGLRNSSHVIQLKIVNCRLQSRVGSSA
jgi:hypothetical protein